MKNKKNIFLINFLLPFLTFAQTDTEIGDLFNEIGTIAALIIKLLMVVATIVLIWGIITYILAAGSDQKKKEGYNLIIWGLVGLFILVAAWGLVAVIESTFGVEREDIPVAPGDIDFD